jgi:hypothetical protein
MSKFRSNRLFALQVSEHDTYFAPREKPSGWRRKIPMVAGLCGVLLAAQPSFQLARHKLTPPQFNLVDKLWVGDLVTVPASDDVLSVTLSGRPLNTIEKPRKTYIGVVGTQNQESARLDLIYAKREEGSRFKHFLRKVFVPNTEHPTVPFFTKKLKVESKSSPALAKADLGADRKPASRAELGASIPETSEKTNDRIKKVFNRTDGTMNASCWAKPNTVLTDQSILIRRNGGKPKPTRLAQVLAASSGDVIFSGQVGNSTRSLVLYHGGGLYSQYDDLKESPYRIGERVRSGKPLGLILPETPTPRQPANAQSAVKWKILLSGPGTEPMEINPESFLKLSSQLCDLK